MKGTSRTLLKKLANGRPKPSKQTLQSLFSDIQNSRIEDLLNEFSPSSRRPPSPKKTGVRKSSALEVHAKSELRKLGGKVKDFLPYILRSVSSRDSNAVPHFAKAKSLTAFVDKLEEVFEKDANAIVEHALRRFTAENDVSYRLAGG